MFVLSLDSLLIVESLTSSQYKKNGNEDFFNPAVPHTTSCPLLPGQTVNIIEPAVLKRSAFLVPSASTTVTMDPSIRWTTPKRPRTITHARGSPPERAEPDMSRQWWFSQSLGRLQTAVVERVLSGFETMDTSCMRGSLGPRQRPHRQRAIHTSAGLDHGKSTPISVPARPDMQRPVGRRRPGLPTRPSDSFINPFPRREGEQKLEDEHTEEKLDQEDDMSDTMDHEDYDVDVVSTERDPARPISWSCSFPHMKMRHGARPSTSHARFPSLSQNIDLHQPESPHSEAPSLHDSPHVSHMRKSIQPLRLDLPLFDADTTTFSNDFDSLKLHDAHGTLFPPPNLFSQTPGSPSSTTFGSYTDSTRQSINALADYSHRASLTFSPPTSFLAETATSPTSAGAAPSSLPSDELLSRHTNHSSSSDMPMLAQTSPPPPTRSPPRPPSPPTAAPEPAHARTVLHDMFSASASQETIRAVPVSPQLHPPRTSSMPRSPQRAIFDADADTNDAIPPVPPLPAGATPAPAKAKAIPIPPIPADPTCLDAPPPPKPRSAGGRVRGMIASFERGAGKAGAGAPDEQQAQSGAREGLGLGLGLGMGLRRSKSGVAPSRGRVVDATQMPMPGQGDSAVAGAGAGGGLKRSKSGRRALAKLGKAFL